MEKTIFNNFVNPIKPEERTLSVTQVARVAVKRVRHLMRHAFATRMSVGDGDLHFDRLRRQPVVARDSTCEHLFFESGWEGGGEAILFLIGWDIQSLSLFPASNQFTSQLIKRLLSISLYWQSGGSIISGMWGENNMGGLINSSNRKHRKHHILIVYGRGLFPSLELFQTQNDTK